MTDQPEQPEQPDLINSPPHYTGFSHGAEDIDITEYLNFNRGNAVKYLARAGSKGASPRERAESEMADLRKAQWYVDREIERMMRRDHDGGE